MTNKQLNATDWTAYYAKKKSWFSVFTQKYTFDIIKNSILDYILKFNPQCALHIAELGGGNSCFAEQLCKTLNINTYDVFDNNELAIDLFNKMILNADNHNGTLINLLAEDNTFQNNRYDFVYSIGLIEHFRNNDIKTIINRHFDYCKSQGLVLISFPTPTKKYLFIRRCMELFGVWQFYDEAPLRYEEVKKHFDNRGKVLAHFVNRKLPLTQMVVIAKKYGD